MYRILKKLWSFKSGEGWSTQIIHYTCCITTKRVTSFTTSISASLRLRATQLLLKKYCSGDKPLATLCPIWRARDWNLRPPVPEPSALPFDQLAGAREKKPNLMFGTKINLNFYSIFAGSSDQNQPLGQKKNKIRNEKNRQKNLNNARSVVPIQGGGENASLKTSTAYIPTIAVAFFCRFA